ncbi:Probable deferrochelatase/peroxidase YfeX [Providencia rustigianii]|uniref:Dyp-type peroxidase family protein n=2 Tax=Providencia rustigianii TaxID=158850 RepID=D1P355_9GAMM|nr:MULTISPECIES: Dyp-type peroxidase [Providencia]EFB72193.1 Dyp-type peroxidase family protein [Providencia rustigianii DSM 4541]MTC55127.1 Dyp-type peroxidase [Providencia rustigianii]MTC61232.1 Dyp-type peroxidase [Providencia rustigianii]SPY78075.1 Probable deferrochelatase/peroxidase YfeX [Providencia rustigianii]SUC27630.1 Probable deferrochelatase/peroxidase YfeX [Providencia rustigianii]
MSHSQSGILKEHSRFGIFIEGMVKGPLDDVKSGCKIFVDELTKLQAKYPDDRLGAVIAFGSDVWQQLGHAEVSPELKPFRTLGKGLAPATQRDIFIHIQSLRHDINFSLAQAALKAFGKSIEVVEEIHGFRWVDDRDLSGFIDGTENPQGEEIAEVTLIKDGEDIGGSYIMVQRYEHDLNKWSRFSEHEQEKMIGRTKHDSVELDESVRNKTSHVSRVVVEEDGEELSVMRHSLPYGTASGKHGLFFVAYCATIHNIEQQLLSMFGETDGKYDDLLRMTKAVSGSYYYAPSIERLLSL